MMRRLFRRCGNAPGALTLEDQLANVQGIYALDEERLGCLAIGVELVD